MDQSSILTSNAQFVPLDGPRGEEDAMRATRRATHPIRGMWVSSDDLASMLEAARVAGHADGLRAASASCIAPQGFHQAGAA